MKTINFPMSSAKWQLFCSVQNAVNYTAVHWRHNGRDNVSNHQPHDRLLNRLFRRRSKKTSQLQRHWSFCGEFTEDRWIPLTNG